MRYAHIDGGMVVNVSIWSSDVPTHDDLGRPLIACEDAGIGWSYDGSVFSPPPFTPDPDDVPGNL